MRKITVFFIFALFFSALPTNAQVNLPANFPTASNYLKIKVRPQNPRPNQEVTISLEYYLTDLKKSEISWFLDGELQEKGFGLTNFRFITNDIGEAQNIRVSILTFEGETISREITIQSSEVDLIWNANTYTPPFYKGKALLTGKGGGLSVTALPNIVDSSGRKINSSSLNYKWYEDGTFLENQSGYGRSSIKIGRATIARPFNVRVIVESIDGSISAERTTRIDYEEPEILIYEKHPLLGTMFNKVISENNVESGEEVTLTATPYFFSTLFKNNFSLNYTWTQNGKVIDQSTGQSTMTFRQPENSLTGQANISVKVSNKEDFTQISTQNFKVILGE